jgi:two-component system, NarL family, response regulator LiaR
MTKQPIRIVIVDDHEVVRGGLQAFIEFEHDMRVVGQASDGIEAIEQFRALLPDVVIMDIVMPKKDGVETINDLRAEFPEAHVLVLTSFTEPEKAVLALRAGALGYLLKSAPTSEILDAIRIVHRGEVVIQLAILRQLVLEGKTEQEVVFEELTIREYEVLKLLARGLTNDEIAEYLVVSKRTVNGHINHILSKLGLANRAQATLFALRKGMIGLFSTEEGSS